MFCVRQFLMHFTGECLECINLQIKIEELEEKVQQLTLEMDKKNTKAEKYRNMYYDLCGE